MIEKNKRTIVYIAVAVWSLLTTIALAMVSHYGITGIEMLLPCVFALCVIVFNKSAVPIFLGNNDEKNAILVDMKYTIPIGSIMSVAAVIGSHIDMEERTFTSMGIVDVIYIVLIIPFFVSVIQLLFFSSNVCISKNVGVRVSCKNYILSMAAMLIGWLPYYLTYFPGGIGNDIFECVNMCLGNIPWTNHHPVFFTAILKLFICIAGSNLNIALGMMVFCQMLLLAFTLSKVIIWLRKRGASALFWHIALIAFTLHPIVAMYSIYVTKDVMFACFVIWLVLELYDWCEAKQAQVYGYESFVKLGVILLLIMFSRNNGTMIAVATMAGMIVVMKKYRRQLFVMTAVVLIINGLYKGPVWKAIGIEKQSFVESASIPLSQIAYTIVMDGDISEDDAKYLESIMPFDRVKEEYEPGYTDSYKFSKYFDSSIVDDNPRQLIKVWINMLPKNLGRYVEVYLMQTSGYWCYGISNTVATEGVQPNELGIFGTDVIGSITGISLKRIMAELVLVARKLPLLCMFSQMAIMIWAVILLCCNYIRKNKREYLLALLPLIVLWLSVMIASPAHCLFRYMCPVFFLWPVIIIEYFSKRQV